MRRHFGAILAVAVVLAGCQALDPGSWTGWSGSRRLVRGLPGAVNGRVPRAFREADVSGGACAAIVDVQGEAMTVHGGTPDGRMFHLALRQVGPNSTLVGSTWTVRPT